MSVSDDSSNPTALSSDREVTEMRHSEDSEFIHVVSISLAIQVCLLEFLLVSTSIPHIQKVKYRTNAKK